MPAVLQILLSLGVWGYFAFAGGSKLVSFSGDVIGKFKQPEVSAYGFDAEQGSKPSKLIQTREFPAFWNVPTREFEPTCLGGVVTHMSLEKQSVAVQTGYVVWHMLIAGVNLDDVKAWLEVESQTEQALCRTVCLSATEKQHILLNVYFDVRGGTLATEQPHPTQSS